LGVRFELVGAARIWEQARRAARVGAFRPLRPSPRLQEGPQKI